MSDASTTAPTVPTKERPYLRLGARLLQARLALQVETSTLAKQLTCNRALISNVEAGRRLPTQERLARWAQALRVVDDLPLLMQLQREDASAAVHAKVRTRHSVMVSRFQAPRS